jgi:hypothetical protein
VSSKHTSPDVSHTLPATHVPPCVKKYEVNEANEFWQEFPVFDWQSV